MSLACKQMSWDLWRCGAVRNLTVPAMTLSYRQVPTLMLVDMHPWFWWAPLLFDNHLSWSLVRYGPYRSAYKCLHG